MDIIAGISENQRSLSTHERIGFDPMGRMDAFW